MPTTLAFPPLARTATASFSREPRMRATDLADFSATDLVALFHARSLSPVEATQAVLARIDRLNPRLNAYCCIGAEDALTAARASEARWMRGAPRSVLDGVPASINDLVLAKGWPTMRGSQTVTPLQPWETDAPATARLREGGVVLVGKTTTPEFGCKGETNSPRTGITRNPWNRNKSPGGSSGGSAAAVAAGMAPLSIGSDAAGGVRVPAGFCGNFGFKPSFGRVPAYPASPMGAVSHVGLHTMSVRDAALAMSLITRPDARDWTSLPPETPHGAHDYSAGLEAGVRGLRVAWSPTLGYAKHVHPEVAAACAGAVQRLAELGAIVEQVDPGFEDPLEVISGLWFVGAWTLWNTLSRDQQVRTDPDFAAVAALGSKLSALEVQRLNLRRGALGAHMRLFMQKWDLLVTPTVAVPAFDAKPAGHQAMDAQSLLGWTPFSYPFNLTHQPACTLPCGLTRDGLPIGVQFVGPMFADALVMRVARAFESVLPIVRPDLARL